MTSIPSAAAISPLRRRMIQDMPVRKFGEKTQHDYLGHIENFVGFWAARRIRLRPRASARYQVHQIAAGLQPPSVNSSAVALHFFFTVTLGRADLAAQLTHVHYPRRLPRVSPRRGGSSDRGSARPGLCAFICGPVDRLRFRAQNSS